MTEDEMIAASRGNYFIDSADDELAKAEEYFRKAELHKTADIINTKRYELQRLFSAIAYAILG